MGRYSQNTLYKCMKFSKTKSEYDRNKDLGLHSLLFSASETNACLLS